MRTGRVQAGFSLVELMVASVIASVIILALTELYAGMSRTNREMEKTSSQIENARFAMQFMESDLVHAGYWAGFVPAYDDFTVSSTPGDVPTAVPDPCLAYSTPWSVAHVDQLIGIPVQVSNGVPGTCGAVVTDKLANTDVLVVRYAETCAAGTTGCDAVVAGRLYFQASNCMTELDAGNRYAFASGVYDLTERDCTTVASRHRFVQRIYYVRDYSVTAGDGIPALVRSDFDLDGAGNLVQLPPRVLVEGIERFRVELGVDNQRSVGGTVVQYGTDYDYTGGVDWEDEDERITPTNRGDGVPDAYVHCGAACTVDQLVNVVGVRIHLLARANESSPGYVDSKDYTLGGLTVNAAALDDAFKRHVFSTTFRLYNISGRRETPSGA